MGSRLKGHAQKAWISLFLACASVLAVSSSISIAADRSLEDLGVGDFGTYHVINWRVPGLNDGPEKSYYLDTLTAGFDFDIAKIVFNNQVWPAHCYKTQPCDAKNKDGTYAIFANACDPKADLSSSQKAPGGSCFALRCNLPPSDPQQVNGANLRVDNGTCSPDEKQATLIRSIEGAHGAPGLSQILSCGHSNLYQYGTEAARTCGNPSDGFTKRSLILEIDFWDDGFRSSSHPLPTLKDSDLDAYVDRVTRNVLAVAANLYKESTPNLLGITLDEEISATGLRTTVLDRVYRAVKANYPSLQILQFYNAPPGPMMNEKWRQGDTIASHPEAFVSIPADGYIADPYALISGPSAMHPTWGSNAYRRLLQKYLISRRKYIGMHWASNEHTHSPGYLPPSDERLVSRNQFTWDYAYNVPIVFYSQNQPRNPGPLASSYFSAADVAIAAPDAQSTVLGNYWSDILRLFIPDTQNLPPDFQGSAIGHPDLDLADVSQGNPIDLSGSLISSAQGIVSPVDQKPVAVNASDSPCRGDDDALSTPRKPTCNINFTYPNFLDFMTVDYGFRNLGWIPWKSTNLLLFPARGRGEPVKTSLRWEWRFARSMSLANFKIVYDNPFGGTIRVQAKTDPAKPLVTVAESSAVGQSLSIANTAVFLGASTLQLRVDFTGKSSADTEDAPSFVVRSLRVEPK